MPFYRRNLPHLQFQGGEYFVTFRLFGSLPANTIQELKSYRKQIQDELKNNVREENRINIERKIFAKYESELDKNSCGPKWLSMPDIAGIIKDSIHFRDGKQYDLYAYCLMSNHVHMVFRHINNETHEFTVKSRELEVFPITHILGNLKKYTSRKCNQALKRKGSFWQAENFDRLIRSDAELESCVFYTLNNPVKANLVSHWQQWPHTYCKPEFLESIR
ncbi:MAG: hypothetical protein GVY08_15900 [Bacteroidetes bacterium]|jgi:REP element-mobilizing transposase RayT|nr:hypothetical protein [Bacteroidota bacterium]